MGSVVPPLTSFPPVGGRGGGDTWGTSLRPGRPRLGSCPARRRCTARGTCARTASSPRGPTATPSKPSTAAASPSRRGISRSTRRRRAGWRRARRHRVASRPRALRAVAPLPSAPRGPGATAGSRLSSPWRGPPRRRRASRRTPTDPPRDGARARPPPRRTAPRRSPTGPPRGGGPAKTEPRPTRTGARPRRARRRA